MSMAYVTQPGFITGNKTAQVVKDRLQPHFNLGCRLAFGPAFMAWTF